MRTKFLFSTLVMAAAFSACTQDEVAVNNENIGSFSEVVGAKQVATGFTVTPAENVASRVGLVNGQYAWTEGDKVAIGWVVKKGESVAYPQTGVALSGVADKLFANHMLVHNGKSFESRSNVFEGWHFAYAPFQYMGKPQVLTVNVNPTLELTDLNLDQYNNAPQFSNAIFVTGTEEDVDFETGKVKKSFPLQWVTNTIKPNLVPSQEFIDSELLNTLKITGITLNAGDANKIFTNSFTVNPAGLQAVDLDEATNLDKTLIDESYFGATKAFQPVVAAYESSTSVAIDNDSYTLGAEKSIVRMFLAPTQDATGVELADLSFRVNVEGGYFLIPGNTTDETNKAALETILGMLQGTYSLTVNDETVTFDLTKTGQPTKNITFNLLPEDFHTDFTIDTYEKWVSCVNMANALDREGTVFEIAPNEEILFPAGEMLVPTKPVNVTCSQPGQSAWLAITGETTWTEGLGTVGGGIGIKVKNGGKLTVDDFVATSAMTIEEGGVLDAKATANVKFHSGSTVINNQGRILVEYGANLTMSTTKANNGVVAYTVDGKETVAQIRRLIAESGNAKGRHSHVNTFIINSPIEWNMLKTEVSGGYEDPYQDEASSTVTYPAGTFDEISFEINGGSVYAADGQEILVKNVTMEGGSLLHVNIYNALVATGDVTVDTDAVGSVEVAGESNATIVVNGNIGGEVEAEKATITAETIGGEVTLKGNATINNAEINDNVTIEAGNNTLNNVTINGTLTVKAGATVVLNSTEYIYITNIVNNGTLKSNNDIFVTNVTLNAKSITTLTDKDEAEMDWNKVIYYTGSYNNSKMTLNGTVLKYSAPVINPSATPEEMGTAATTELENAPVDGVVFMPEGIYEFTKLSQIDLEGASIICEPGTVINSAVNNAANKVLYYTLGNAKQVVLRNFTISAGTTKADVWFRNDNMLENGVVDIIIENVNCKSMLFDFGYKEGTTANIKFINCEIDKVDVHANHATSIMNVEYDSASHVNIIPGGTYTENVTVTLK